MHGGSSLYALDEEALAAAEPDLILTQELCQVCAVSYREVNEVARAIDADITVVSLEPTSIEGILNTIATVGAMTEAEDAAVDVVESCASASARSRSRSRRAATPAATPPRVVAPRVARPAVRRRATGCRSRSAAPVAGTCSGAMAIAPSRRRGTRSARSTRRCSC